MTFFHPFIVSVWGSDIYQFPNNCIRKSLIKNIFLGCDLVCSTSYAMVLEIKKYYNRRVAVTPFGVNMEEFFCRTPILSGNDITIGIVKSLEEIYGLDCLIDVFHSLCLLRKDENLRLLIVEDGSMREYLEDKCRYLNITDRVTFSGRMDNKRVPEYINMMDLVCMPSISEIFGAAAIEACACGRP